MTITIPTAYGMETFTETDLMEHELFDLNHYLELLGKGFDGEDYLHYIACQITGTNTY